MADLVRTTLKPIARRPSYYNLPPEKLEMLAADLPGMVGVKARDLFPDIPEAIPMESQTVIRAKIRELTKQTFDKVDLSKIQAGDSVNILVSHHGFSIYGGEAYAEMVRTLRDEIERRCNTSDITLLAGVGLRFNETKEYLKRFELDKYFYGKVGAVAPVDPGVAIETEIGTLYGIKRVYQAKWIIHAHNNDVRELHYHRQLGRLFKPFAMSYATIETRSTFHQSLGPRSANLLARAIYESPFVQSKFVASVFLQVSPSGIVGVDASNDLVEQDKRLAKLNLAWYGKMISLLAHIKEVIIIIDYPGPMPYTTAGGILFGNFLNANVDEFDLDKPYPPFTRYTDMLYPGKEPLSPNLPKPNPAIKTLIVNYSSKGYPGIFFAQQLPTMVIGPQADLLRGCEQNTTFMDSALDVENLEKAVAFARKSTGTDNIFVIDGAVGGYNVSAAMAEELKRLAPIVNKEVDEVLMPLWLKQRNIT